MKENQIEMQKFRVYLCQQEKKTANMKIYQQRFCKMNKKSNVTITQKAPEKSYQMQRRETEQQEKKRKEKKKKKVINNNRKF